MRMTASAPKIAAETRLVGLPISGGAALAKLCLFNESRHNNLPTYSVTAAGAPAERDRLVRAAKIATERLDELVREVTDRIGPAEAAVCGRPACATAVAGPGRGVPEPQRPHRAGCDAGL